jgi:hypothetical protein
MKDTIFISIAALEEPNLIKTIKSSLGSADNPDNISFGISLQYESEPDLSFLTNKIKVISYSPNIDLPNAPGIIEIRSELRGLLDDEEYFLQIDSHTRFEKGWDTKLISDLKQMREGKEKTIISSQLWHEADQNRYTQIRIHPTYHYQLDMHGLDVYGELVTEKSFPRIEKKMINDSYFLNSYCSGNFIFAHRSFLSGMTFPDYHKFPFEEAELSLVTYCNGYDIVAPTIDNVVIFADNDEKYHEKNNPRWWTKVGEDPVRKWVFDDKEMFFEVCNLMLFGKNKYLDISNLEKSVEDFYSSTHSLESFKDAKLWYNSI